MQAETCRRKVRSMRGKGVFGVLVGIGLVGVVWAIVDVVDRGWSSVPGSTWVCAVLGLVLVVFALYREFGGSPLITVDHENIAEEYEASTEGHAAGCMVVTTRMTPDRGSQDPRVARILDRALGRQLAMLEHAVRAGRFDGSAAIGRFTAPTSVRIATARAARFGSSRVRHRAMMPQ